MRFSLAKKTPGQIEFGVIYGAIAVIILGFCRWPGIHSLTPDCVFKGLTAIACPTCGSTRAMVYLSHGSIASAFTMNPLVTIAFIAVVLYFPFSLLSLAFDLPRITCVLTDREKRLARAGTITLVLAQWAYLAAVL